MRKVEHCRIAGGHVNQVAMSFDGGQKIRFCTSRDGVRLGFAACGTGPTVIAAAHWISHLRLDWDNPIRRAWLSMLSRRHTLIRYDARGTGLSDRDPPDFSLERQIEDLEAVVEAAKCDRFALLGLWTGGAVAIRYAVRHPERVTHLVLHACATRGRLARDPRPEQVEEAEAQLKLIELGWANENAAFCQLHTSQLMPDATGEQARAFNDLMRQTTTPGNAARLLRAHWTEVDNRAVSAGGLPHAGVACAGRWEGSFRRSAIACRARSWRPIRTAREPQSHPGRGRAGLAAVGRPAAGVSPGTQHGCDSRSGCVDGWPHAA